MCKKIKKVTFCSCENELNPINHRKKSKRNRDESNPTVTYIWTLVKFVEHFESMMEGLIAQPSEKLDQNLTSDFVLQELNNRNCFDFNYLPNEGDCLTIRRNDKWEFFSYIFKDGLWTVGMYNQFYEKTQKFNAGKLEITEENEF